MSKATPYSLQGKPLNKFTRTFSNYINSHFTCSCGLDFNVETPENYEGIPICPNTELNSDHIVVANEPQLKFDVTFKKLSKVDVINVQDYLNEMSIKYIYGSGKKGMKDYVAPLPLPAVAGKLVTITPTLCQIAAILVKSQIMEDPYTFEEICSFMTSDSICEQMLRVTAEIQEDSNDLPFGTAAM